MKLFWKGTLSSFSKLLTIAKIHQIKICRNRMAERPGGRNDAQSLTTRMQREKGGARHTDSSSRSCPLGTASSQTPPLNSTLAAELLSGWIHSSVLLWSIHLPKAWGFQEDIVDLNHNSGFAYSAQSCKWSTVQCNQKESFVSGSLHFGIIFLRFIHVSVD